MKTNQQKSDLRCIYCQKKGSFSREHYLPEGLGSFEGMELLNDRICVKCNSLLTKIEGPLLNTSPIGLFRQIHKLKSRKNHDNETPFYQGDHGTPPIQILGKDPLNNFEINWELDQDSSEIAIRQLRHIVFEYTNGERKAVRIKDRIKNSSDLESLLKELNIEIHKPMKIYLYASEDEREWLTNIISPIFPNVSFDWSETPPGERQVHMSFELDESFFRCIAKIGFHYFLKQYHDFYTGHEDAFSIIKQYIIAGIGTADLFISQTQSSVIDFQKGKSLKNPGHILIVSIDDDINTEISLCIDTSIFELPFHYLVSVGNNPRKVIPNQGTGHSFIYFDLNKRKTHDGIMESLTHADFIQVP